MLLRTFRTAVAAILSCGLSVGLSAAQTFTQSVLHSFAPVDGIQPTGVIQASDGNFYGTAYFGGPGAGTSCPQSDIQGQLSEFLGCGTIFKLGADGTFSVIHNMDATKEGSQPGQLIEGSDGNLYGVAFEGGPKNHGTVFRLTTSGKFTVLYSFTGGIDGAYPLTLILANDENLYGTTVQGGGADNFGTIFRVTTSGTLNTLYSFTWGSSVGLVQGSDGDFYGMAGCTTFRFNKLTGTSRVLSTFCSFGGYTGPFSLEPILGITPAISLPTTGGVSQSGCPTTPFVPPPAFYPNILTEGSDGNFYGAWPGSYFICAVYLTPDSGQEFVDLDFGSIFRVSPDGTSAILYPFDPPPLPSLPLYPPGGFFVSSGVVGSYMGLMGSDGNFYGTELRMTPDGVYTDPKLGISGPYLVQGSDGSIYGTSGSALLKLTPTPRMAGPVQLSFSSTTVTQGSAVNLSWSVANAFSATMQQCNAFVQRVHLQGDNATELPSGVGNWTGLQAGSISNGYYSGSTVITPNAVGTYIYALTCGGQESGFATLTVTSDDPSS